MAPDRHAHTEFLSFGTTLRPRALTFGIGEDFAIASPENPPPSQRRNKNFLFSSASQVVTVSPRRKARRWL